jgi:O-antigen ligase
MKAVGFMLFAYVWRVQDIIPILGAIHLPLLATGVTLLLYQASRQPWRRMAQLRTPIVYIVLGIFAVMLAGVSTSLWRSHSLSFALQDYLQNIVFMGLVAASIRSVRDVEWYTALNLYGALFYAIFVSLFFSVDAGGRLSDLVYYDANDFALILVLTIPFAVYFLRSQSGSRRRMLGLVAIGFFMLGIVKSGSRGGFLGLLTVLLYILIRYRAIPTRVRLFAAVGGLGLVVVLGSTEYWQQMRSIMHPETDYNWSDPQGRREIWTRGISYVEQRPILGVGVGAFPVAEGTLSVIGRELASRGSGFKWSVAHNSFVETAAELGIPGIILFVSLLITTIATMARVRSGRRYGPLITNRETALGQMMVGSLLGYCAGGFFVSAEYYSYLYFLVGLAIGLDKVLRLRRRATMTAIAAYVSPVRLSSMPSASMAAVRPPRP